RGSDAVPPLPFGPVPPGGGRRPNTQAGLEGSNDARTGMPPGIPGGAMCVQRLDDSLNSAFTLVIAFRCVLHRCRNQEIHWLKV
ncbi:hypothetical protein BO70DRAFT_407447, partial [Aspergillus heteromorphus CBS 117.55]